jgi:hypothetical protein
MTDMEHVDDAVQWLEGLVRAYDFDVIGLARRQNRPPYPLPTEPGALANILETTAVRLLTDQLESDPLGVRVSKGTERKYPDMELHGGALGDRILALDVKVARRRKPPRRPGSERRTQSRITLLTGNTYFARPNEAHPSIMRPYNLYWAHLDWIMLFDIDVDAAMPEVSDVEHVIAETWRIASRQRSSETRNYVGAVDSLSDLRAKRGEFNSREEFEHYWRRTYTGWRETPGLAERRAAYAVEQGSFSDLQITQEEEAQPD